MTNNNESTASVEAAVLTEADWHKRFAVSYFNATWDLLDKTERTHEEDLKMIRLAQASRCHWGEVGIPLNFERGDWQISRVYAVLGRGEPALIYAKECLRVCEENGVGGFDIAFAYEAMARAYAALGDKDNFSLHYAKATEFGEKIEDAGDREYFFTDLQGGAWFGMR